MNRYLSIGSTLVVSAVLFGVYHFAHSPLFNMIRMVSLLTVVGVGTGLVYFGGGSFYGALVFHNIMALFGVVSLLADAGQLMTYQQPIVPPPRTALVALVILVVVERAFVRTPQTDEMETLPSEVNLRSF